MMGSLWFGVLRDAPAPLHSLNLKDSLQIPGGFGRSVGENDEEAGKSAVIIFCLFL